MTARHVCDWLASRIGRIGNLAEIFQLKFRVKIWKVETLESKMASTLESYVGRILPKYSK
jgi:hypothetical protein